MTDVVNRGEGRPQTHRCYARSGAEALPGVFCFECYRASRHTAHEVADASPDRPGLPEVSGPQPMAPRRALTPRQIRHRGRMLDWLRQA